MGNMLKAFAIAGAVVLGGVMSATAAPTTEIDKAAAVLALAGTPSVKDCIGEDTSTSYRQFSVNYAGSETDASPAVPTDPVTGGPDHGLAGDLTLTKGKFTINSLTGRGIGKGTLTLTAGPTAVKVYSGTLTIVLQKGGSGFLGRGWLSASTFDASGTKDGFVFANVELDVAADFSTMKGVFGDGISGTPMPPFSVETGLKDTC